MSIVLRISLVIVLVCGAGLYFVTRFEINETKRRYREATEEPLVDLAMVLAAHVSEASLGDALNVENIRSATTLAQNSPLHARIYSLERTSFDLRIYVTDNKGIVVYDSNAGRDEGKDYSAWNDVYKTLRAEYGARNSDTITPTGGKTGSVLYVAAPIIKNNNIIGVISIGKPTRSANLFIRGAKRSTLVLTAFAFLCCTLVAFLLSFVVAAPVRSLTKYVRSVRDGKRVMLPKLPQGELRTLGEAFEEMRDALEGRKHAERYVQTLAHALKSPLSGIRGAVELLAEGLPVDEQRRFITNIASDAMRMQQLLDKLLALSTLQREKTLSAAEEIELYPLLEEVRTANENIAKQKGLSIVLTCAQALTIYANRLWLKEALINLLQNAIEFSPQAASVVLSASSSALGISIIVRDHGPGIPDWAKGQIFERFYSLPRPDGSTKSTGLGLAIVKEVAELHGGSITIENHAEGGAEAVLLLPRKS